MVDDIRSWKKKMTETGWKTSMSDLLMVMQPSLHGGSPRKDARVSVHYRSNTIDGKSITPV